MELLCPAGNLAAVKSALIAGADAIYLGLRNETNARSFAGLNFTPDRLEQAVKLIHRRGKQAYLTLNTFARPGQEARWYQAIDLAAELRMDAIIVADLALLAYARANHPALPLHLSVQASASNAAALRFYRQQFNIRRAVLPRVLSTRQIQALGREKIVDLEVFAFGSLCIMAEGRCRLSSWVTGQSPNTGGSCSPAKFVRWQENGANRDTLLNHVLIDRSGLQDAMGYPVVCKGRYLAASQTKPDAEPAYLLQSPTSLCTLTLLPQLQQAGVVSLKIEGRQRSPAYVDQVTRVWRQAIDSLTYSTSSYRVETQWQKQLAKISEGQITTPGAYSRDWQ